MTLPLMSPPRNNGARSFPLWLTLSALVHVGAVAAVVFFRTGAPARPPVYRVEIIGAAGMKKQMGVVGEQAVVESPAPAPAPTAAERPPEPVAPAPPRKTRAKPIPKPAKATPNPTRAKDSGKKSEAKPLAKTAPPVAGSASKTGKGTDVTNMVADGIAFPYPEYLTNIIRQITLNFDWTRSGSWAAEVKFLIHRDGSVSDMQVLTRSGNGEFDREAQGSIEAAGSARSFRPLPSGFNDDVLPVYFTFTPAKSNP